MGIRLGYFENFKGADALLLEVDNAGLRALASWVRVLTNHGASQDLRDLDTAHIYGDVRLKAEVAPVDIGLIREVDGSLTWRRTRDGWADVEAKLAALQHVAAGHQYLEATRDKVVPIVSVGEYGDQWWLEHAG